MRIAVVGAGVMGCAAARELAGDGHEVVLYEQFDVGHDRGSSHGRSRIVRLAYPKAQWVRLAEQAFAGWHELERECGEPLLELSGLVELASDPALSSRAALTEAGAEITEFTGSRWPITVPAGWTALLQPRAGIVRADRAVRAFLDGALRRGATLREGVRITSTDDVDADVVVVTAGSWVRRLVPDVPVRTTRETVAYFRRAGEPLPSVVAIDGRRLWYSLWDPRHGLKAGSHHSGAELDPDLAAEPDPEVVARIAQWVAATHPDADPTPVDLQTCLYTTTDDERFVVERRDRVVIGSACSGHGFKFAPAVGRRLADLAR